jgi:hypothetical protein
MSDKAVDPRIKLLRTLLQRMRNSEQGGYDDVRHGSFVRAIPFPYPTVEELNALFSLAGIVPDAIPINGTCATCVFGNPRLGDQGWAQPCSSCSRPKMTNFVPLAAVRASALRLTKIQETYLRNVQAARWWATDIVTAPSEPGSLRARRAQFNACERARKAMFERDMVRDSLGHASLTNKGMAALRRSFKMGKGKAA